MVTGSRGPGDRLLPRRPPGARGAVGRPVVVVLGDLMLDVVIAPAQTPVLGTDVPGRVKLRQGGSAATTARWLARLGARATLVCAVGRDGVGRALVQGLTAEGARLRLVRVPGSPTGRIGVLLSPDGERSFVAERGAADSLRPEDLQPAWFRGAALLHLPAYSLLGEPLGRAGMRAVELARAAGALVSLDLASIRPLLAGGRPRASALIRQVGADLLFATAQEGDALLGGRRLEALLEMAPVVIVKRGAEGASVLALEGTDRLRFEVATHPVQAADSTGAGDAFDAGFLASWLRSLRTGLPPVSSLQRATLAGHRVAARHLASPEPEVRLG